jgi:hypothetical protein
MARPNAANSPSNDPRSGANTAGETGRSIGRSIGRKVIKKTGMKLQPDFCNQASSARLLQQGFRQISDESQTNRHR